MYQISSLRKLLSAWVAPSKTRVFFFFFSAHVYPVAENSMQSGSKPSALAADSVLAHTQVCQLSLVFTSFPFTQHGNGQLTFCPCALLWLHILCSLPSVLFLRTGVGCPKPLISFPEGPLTCFSLLFHKLLFQS